MKKRISGFSGKKIIDIVINNFFLILTLILVIVVTVQRPSFIARMPLNLLYRTTAYGTMALGMGGILLIGGVDLSAGRIMGLTSLVAAALLHSENSYHYTYLWPGFKPWPIMTVLLLVVVIGAVIGAFNGLFVAKFKLHPYIVTISTQMMLYGLMLIFLNVGPSYSGGISIFLEEYKELIAGDIVKFGTISIPNYVWYSIAMIIIVWIIWNKTKLGRNMYLVGNNPEVARASGVSVFGTIVSVYAIAGVLYAVNGFIEAARVGGPGASAGANAELDAIAACIIGGVSLKGGIGKISGIVYGVILLQLISIALQWLSVSVNYRYIIKGAIILLAVVIDARKNYAKK